MNTETSYAFNAQVFHLCNNMIAVRDGSSNTIFFSEHYWQCGKAQTHFVATNWSARIRLKQNSVFPASFADGGPRINDGLNCRDFYPVTKGNPPVASANRYNAMFQVQPREQDCDPRLPNASSSAGLQAAMGDGSVRIFSPSTSPSVFWGAVTPNSGEVIAFD